MKRKAEQAVSDSKRVRCDKERRVRLRYVQCAGASRLGLLGKLIQMKRKKGSDLRVAVIFKSDRACLFHTELFRALRFPPIQLPDNDDNIDTTPTSEGGLWFLTEAEGAQSKLKDIDYLVIFDPVESIESLQRLIQLCKSDGTATSLVFLHQQEVGLLPLLAEHDLEHREMTISKNAFNNIIQQANKAVKSSFLISQTAQGAYKSFVTAYRNAALSSVYDLARLELQEVAASFALEVPPRVEEAAPGGAPTCRHIPHTRGRRRG